MIEITPERLSPILREYGIGAEIKEISLLANEQENGIVHMTAKLTVGSRLPLVIKLLRDPTHPHNQIERQCVFAEHLRHNGISTPEHYAKNGCFCLERPIGGVRVNITLEDYCEGKLTAIDGDTAAKAGEMMARIHRMSFRDNFKIGSPTRYSAIGQTAVSGIDHFRELTERAEESQVKSITYPHRYCKKPELCREIIAIYDHKIAGAADVWGRLPCSAVQGDFLVGNMIMDDGRLGLIDFSRAGDETLIGDMILEGLLLSQEGSLADNLTDSDRSTIFRRFLDGYRAVCPLTSDERIAACEIYPAISALWFRRVDELERLMTTAGDCDAADSYLEETYDMINADARRIFASELFTK